MGPLALRITAAKFLVTFAVGLGPTLAAMGMKDSEHLIYQGHYLRPIVRQPLSFVLRILEDNPRHRHNHYLVDLA